MSAGSVDCAGDHPLPLQWRRCSPDSSGFQPGGVAVIQNLSRSGELASEPYAAATPPLSWLALPEVDSIPAHTLLGIRRAAINRCPGEPAAEELLFRATRKAMIIADSKREGVAVSAHVARNSTARHNLR